MTSVSGFLGGLLAVLVCIRGGVEMVRATVPADAVIWSQAPQPGWPPTGLWATATWLALPNTPLVWLVLTVQDGGVAQRVVDPRECRFEGAVS